jgi:predicted ABC-type transport system involved in lysophospholipase L1 biosynthesis ATPase subunit
MTHRLGPGDMPRRAPTMRPREQAPPVVQLERVGKDYPGGVAALKEVSLTIGEGELVAIVGPSGSGKSTLLHLIGTLDRPSYGVVRIAGDDVGKLSDRELSALRSRLIGCPRWTTSPTASCTQGST